MRLKRVREFPAYFVNDSGEVFTLSEIGRPRIEKYAHKYDHARHPPMRKMSLSFHKFGYPVVSLKERGRRRTVPVHTLVLEAFAGPRPPGSQCRHLNGNCKDCRLENLKWGTPFQNALDKRLHGTIRCGEKHQNARLTEKDVIEIRHLAKTNRHADIANIYRVSKSCISAIVRKRTWKTV